MLNLGRFKISGLKCSPSIAASFLSSVSSNVELMDVAKWVAHQYLGQRSKALRRIIPSVYKKALTKCVL